MNGYSIDVAGVEKVYPGNVHALSDIDFHVEDNEFAVLLGPSGCGKSTLLNIIAGFEDVTAGRASVFGETVATPGPERAVVFQEAALFPWLSVLDNVTFGPRMQGRARAEYLPIAEELLDHVGLADFHDKLPSQLSGGMKQRVGIARALVMDPRVLLMDEPFGALDAQTRLSMQELLLDVWEKHKKTVLFITHDIDEAILLADTVYIMSARPGTIAVRIPIELERPRGIELLTDDRFNALRREIMGHIRKESQKTKTAA